MEDEDGWEKGREKEEEGEEEASHVLPSLLQVRLPVFSMGMGRV